MTEREKFLNSIQRDLNKGVTPPRLTINKKELAKHFQVGYLPASGGEKEKVDWVSIKESLIEIQEYIYKCINEAEEKTKDDKNL